MKRTVIFSMLLSIFSSGCINEEQLVIEKRMDVAETSPPPEKKLNRMGNWLTDHDRETLVRAVAQDFELMNPDIDVNPKYPPQIMGVRSREEVGKYIARMIMTGDIGWDIIRMGDVIYWHTAEELGDPGWGEKYLVDFERVDGFKETQKSFIMDDPVYRKHTGSIIIGPYIDGYYYYYYLIYCNKDVAEKMGIEVKQYGMTFDNLLGCVREVEEYNQGNNTNIAIFYKNKNYITTELLFQNLLKSEPAELPVFQETDYYLGGYISTWAVMKDAPNREGGIKLLMFRSMLLVAEKWVRYAKAPTGLVGHLSTSDQVDDVFEQFQAAITDRYGGNVHYSANVGYIFGEENRLLQNDLNELLIRLLDGEITAEQAFEEIMELVE